MPDVNRSIFHLKCGTTLSLSLPRKVICDLVHYAHRIPTVPVQRIIDIGKAAAFRERLQVRVGWCALFTKAYGYVVREMPELRRAYLEYPWARLYQHPDSIASVAIEREFEGEPGVFFAQVQRPEETPLSELEVAIQRHKHAPVADVYNFILKFYRLPRAFRRLLWWYILNVRGSRKAQYLGTFGVSAYSSLGAESLHPISPLTTTLNYGIIGEDGRVPVRIVYDHRVIDGGTVARALVRLEEVLRVEICEELDQMGDRETEVCAPVQAAV